MLSRTTSIAVSRPRPVDLDRTSESSKSTGLSESEPPTRMATGKPRLWIIGTTDASAAEVRQRLAGAFDIQVMPASPLSELGDGGRPEYILAAPDDLRILNAAPSAAAALLDSVGQGVCLARPDGEVVWANTRYARYDERTRAAIGSACRDAAKYFQGGPTVGPAHADATRRVEIALPDGDRAYEVILAPALTAGRRAESTPSR